MVICLERGADLHMAQLMPLPLTGSCFSKIQIGFTFLVPAYPGRLGHKAVKRMCVCVVIYLLIFHTRRFHRIGAGVDTVDASDAGGSSKHLASRGGRGISAAYARPPRETVDEPTGAGRPARRIRE